MYCLKNRIDKINRVPEKYPIQPHQIELMHKKDWIQGENWPLFLEFCGLDEDCAEGVEAIVAMAQEKGGWDAFTIEDLKGKIVELGYERLHFNLPTLTTDSLDNLLIKLRVVIHRLECLGYIKNGKLTHRFAASLFLLWPASGCCELPESKRRERDWDHAYENDVRDFGE